MLITSELHLIVSDATVSAVVFLTDVTGRVHSYDAVSSASWSDVLRSLYFEDYDRVIIHGGRS